MKKNLIFCDSHKKIVLKDISKLYKNKKISFLLRSLTDVGDVWLIGGAIKDIGLFNKKPKDYDFVLISDEDYYLPKIEGMKTLKNSFGGLKVSIDNVDFDIAQKKRADGIYSMFQLNVDFLAINIATESLISREYNEGIISGKLKELNDNLRHPVEHKNKERIEKYCKKLKLEYVQKGDQ
ncbi:hypothetical protein [Bacillus altitudinis]|uniref:hypothetical protein n=1 Tax=Bacillus altitudinis TaxID=293387 RepID=UPI002FFE1A07